MAYRLWEQDGRPSGHAVEEWLRAEAEWERTNRRTVAVSRTTSPFRSDTAASTGSAASRKVWSS
jgi:hypothetical protein